MSADPTVVSVIVRSANPAGKGELLQALNAWLASTYPDLTVKTAHSFEDIAPFNHFGTVELIEAIDAPGLGSLLANPGVSQAEADAQARKKAEISQLLHLFLSQVKSEHFVHAKVEYPLGNDLLTLAGVAAEDGEQRFQVIYVQDGHSQDWTCSDIDQAMDVFRHYATDPKAPAQTWVWVKTMDVPRSQLNYLKYVSGQGMVEFWQQQSGLADGDFYYAIRVVSPGQEAYDAKPQVAGSFSVAVEYFLRCAQSL